MAGERLTTFTTSRLLLTLQVRVAPAQQFGALPPGTRVIAPISNGTFDGPRLQGTVLPGGSDWTLLRSDGMLELGLRFTLLSNNPAIRDLGGEVRIPESPHHGRQR